jgi:hypothetical protein
MFINQGILSAFSEALSIFSSWKIMLIFMGLPFSLMLTFYSIKHAPMFNKPKDD